MNKQSGRRINIISNSDYSWYIRVKRWAKKHVAKMTRNKLKKDVDKDVKEFYNKDNV